MAGHLRVASDRAHHLFNRHERRGSRFKTELDLGLFVLRRGCLCGLYCFVHLRDDVCVCERLQVDGEFAPIPDDCVVDNNNHSSYTASNGTGVLRLGYTSTSLEVKLPLSARNLELIRSTASALRVPCKKA